MNFDFKPVYLMVLITILLSRTTFSQVQNEFLIEQIMEAIAHNLTEDHDYSEITERLNYYKRTQSILIEQAESNSRSCSLYHRHKLVLYSITEKKMGCL